MYNKLNHLLFTDSQALVEMEYSHDVGEVIITVREMVEDEEQTTSEHKVYKPDNTAEIYLDVEETKVLIDSLQNLLPKDDE